MVIYRVLDGDENPITNVRVRPNNEMIDIIIDSFEIFSRAELILFMNLIEKRIEYGSDVPTTKQYLDLYDKIQKIVCRNDCK